MHGQPRIKQEQYFTIHISSCVIHNQQFYVRVPKLQKATFSFLMSVRPSVLPLLIGTDFHKICWEFSQDLQRTTWWGKFSQKHNYKIWLNDGNLFPFG